jgi:hypothetical protein
MKYKATKKTPYFTRYSTGVIQPQTRRNEPSTPPVGTQRRAKLSSQSLVNTNSSPSPKPAQYLWPTNTDSSANKLVATTVAVFFLT